MAKPKSARKKVNLAALEMTSTLIGKQDKKTIDSWFVKTFWDRNLRNNFSYSDFNQILIDYISRNNTVNFRAVPLSAEERETNLYDIALILNESIKCPLKKIQSLFDLYSEKFSTEKYKVFDSRYKK